MEYGMKTQNCQCLLDLDCPGSAVYRSIWGMEKGRGGGGGGKNDKGGK